MSWPTAAKSSTARKRQVHDWLVLQEGCMASPCISHPSGSCQLPAGVGESPLFDPVVSEIVRHQRRALLPRSRIRKTSSFPSLPDLQASPLPSQPKPA